MLNVHMNKQINCYPVGKYQNHKSGPILIKFATIDDRNNCFNTKRLLINSGIIIKDDLTKDRVQIIKLFNDKFGCRNTWSQFGTIYAKQNDNIYKFTTMYAWNQEPKQHNSRHIKDNEARTYIYSFGI